MNIDNFLMPHMKTAAANSKQVLSVVLLSTMLVACGDDDNNTVNSSVPSLDLAIPQSLTGGQATIAAKSELLSAATSVNASLKLAKAGTGEPCAYLGNEDDDDPFRNGYETSKFMISIMASWTCIADLIIDVATFVPHNGAIFETENDNNSDDFEADEPTHYSVTDESASQVTVRLYYNYSRSQPPITGEKAQFYISWNEAVNGDIEGRMIIDRLAVEWDDHDVDDPNHDAHGFQLYCSNKNSRYVLTV